MPSGGSGHHLIGAQDRPTVGAAHPPRGEDREQIRQRLTEFRRGEPSPGSRTLMPP